MKTKNIYLSFIILLAIAISSCTGNNTKSHHRISSSKTKSDTNTLSQESKHYTYFMPYNNKVDGILAIIDPHGKPNLIMDSLHSFADSNHLALIGLKEIENGISGFNFIIGRDIKHFIAYKNLKNIKVYLLGFSGGARMALLYSQRNRIDGLIVCGAGLQRQTQLPYPVVMMSGLRDFNFMEQYYSPNNPKTFEKNILAIHFHGKHQWPPIKDLYDAIGFIVQRNIGVNDSKSEYYTHLSEKYFSEKDYFLSFKSMEVAYKLSDNSNIEKMRTKLVALSQNPKIKTYFNRLNKYITDEQERYQMLGEALKIQNLKWWNNQINYMKAKTTSSNKLEAESYSRTLAYLGILMYSRLNATAAGRGEFDLFPKYLSIYEKIEPKNPDLFFFKGIYAYTQGQEDEAIHDLKNSLKLGFTDINKMKKFFSQDFLNSVL